MLHNENPLNIEVRKELERLLSSGITPAASKFKSYLSEQSLPGIRRLLERQQNELEILYRQRMKR